MLEIFGALSGILAFVGLLPYVRDIFLHRAKPQRTTFLIWTLLGAIAFFSQAAKGASFSLWLPAIETALNLFVFLLSLRFGIGGLAKKDYAALCVAVLGLVLWYFSSEPAIALFSVILVDAAGSYLTLDKTYKYPESETLTYWVFATLAGIFAALSIGGWNIMLLSYPIYIALANFGVVIAVLLGRRKKRVAAKSHKITINPI